MPLKRGFFQKTTQQSSKCAVRLLHTTDLHGCALGYDYHANAPTEDGGLSRAATLINQLRRDIAIGLLLDTGDFLQGTPLSDGPQAMQDGMHPMIAAMNALGYDAATLGNHDLDYGVEHLSRALESANFPIVSANLDLPNALFPMLQRYVLLERALSEDTPRLKIGITGCLPLETLKANLRDDSRIRCRPIGTALSETIHEMRAVGADLVIVMAHCGLGSEAGSTGETIRNTIAPLGDIDAILGGHSHEVYPDQTNETERSLEAPAVTLAGARGQHIGQIDIPLLHGAHGWTREGAAVARVHPTKGASEAQAIKHTVQTAHQNTLKRTKRAVGWAKGPISSHFALVANCSALQIIAQAFETRIEEELAKRPFYAPKGLPVLGMAAPYKTGQQAGPGNYVHIREGPITEGDIDALYGFPDRLTALEITGAQLRIILEKSASIYQTIQQGIDDQPLLEPLFPGYRFDVIPRLSYQIDLGNPALFDEKGQRQSSTRGRIRTLCFDGQRVNDSDRFILAANSHRTLAGTGAGLFDTGVRCRDVIEQFIQSAREIDPEPRASWSFCAAPNTSAIFDTSPHAVMPEGGAFEPLGMTDEGFCRMRMHFADNTHGEACESAR